MGPGASDGTLSLRAQHDAMRDGRVLGWECEACRRRTITPKSRCVCGGQRFRIVEFAHEGTVVTYTIQHVASEQFLNDVPFAWVVVELDGGPRVSGWVPFIARAEELPIGQRVRFVTSYRPGMTFEKA